ITGAPAISVTRSSSLAPRGSPTSTSKRGTPAAKVSATSLPPGWETYTFGPLMVMPGDVRSDSAGVARVTVHFFSPVLASYATIRLSTLRTTTTSAPTAGADSTSLDACAVQTGLPLPSNARIWPLTPPTTTSVPSVLTPTPAVRSVPALTRHCCLPVAAFRRAIAPSASATKTSPAASAGENTDAPALPIEYFHASCTFRSALKSTSLAGGVLLSLAPNSEQPAISASTPAAIAFSVLRISLTLIFTMKHTAGATPHCGGRRRYRW